MSVAETIRAMRAAGVSDGQILDALVELDAQQEEKREERRAKARLRKARQRQRERENVTRDICDRETDVIDFKVNASRVTSVTSRDTHEFGEDTFFSKKKTPKGVQKVGKPDSLPPKPIDEVSEAFQIWNAMAHQTQARSANKLTKSRSANIRARLREHGLDGWRAAVEKVRVSDFCQGSNPRQWRADLDWLCRESGFLRLTEGSFDNPRKAKPQASDANWEQEIRSWVDTGAWRGPGAAPNEDGFQGPDDLVAELIAQIPAGFPKIDQTRQRMAAR